MAIEWLLFIVCLPVFLFSNCSRNQKKNPAVIQPSTVSASSPRVVDSVKSDSNLAMEQMEKTQETTPPKLVKISSGKQQRPVKKTKKDDRSMVEEKEQRDKTKTTENTVDKTQKTELTEKTAKKLDKKNDNGQGSLKTANSIVE